MEGVTEHRFIANFRKYKFLLNQLIKRDLQLKYRRSVLGIFWSFLEPLLTMIVLTIIFSTLFRGFGIDNYPVYLLTGRLIFTFFAGGSNAAMRSIMSNAGILKTIYIPKYIYPLSGIASNFITFILSLVVLFLVMLATNVDFTIYMVFTVLPIIALLFFTIGVGLILATINVFFRDLEYLYGVFLTLLMYATPIFYPPEIVPESFRFIQTYNPIFAVINTCRVVFLEGRLYDPMQMLFAMVSGIVALVIGLIVFYKYQNKFILHI
ncbi:ABC transporter permease [Methanobacterium alkalithermotolerans]|uniref:ABC transporter permease n=1 Tax=Methanobacterium alkalithermotolerans TaxID=2731220 RepID=A0A8T8KEN5_9EURY|nr:ABC transporter permease [Methanobacterium alkalithermotolerans]QUH23761.1 ABC transporter permease [Methanobacterium alkalithermotolerans]